MTRGFSLARLRRDLFDPADLPGREFFLVGGIVRDGLDGRRELHDIDLAVADGEEEIARRLSRRGWGKPFQIAGARHGISVWRVAGKSTTVDVARFGGSTGIAGDLGRRDFTINAMARDLRSGRLLDPFGGRRDLRQRLIRAISASNFDDDPLRLLRAYRFAAQLDASVVPATRALIRPRAGSLAGVAAERIRDELVRLLGGTGNHAARSIVAAGRDGVLAAALGIACRRPLTAGSIRRIEGEDAVTNRLVLLFRRAEIRAADAVRLLDARRFGGPFARRVGSRLRLLEAALDHRFDGRNLHRAFAEASNPAPTLVSAATATPTERRRARRFVTWIERARRTPLPVNGHEISSWLAVAPGPLLGSAIAEARFRWFIGEWTGCRLIRAGLRRWIALEQRIDRLRGPG